MGDYLRGEAVDLRETAGALGASSSCYELAGGNGVAQLRGRLHEKWIVRRK
jgi:hypothetical protein